MRKAIDRHVRDRGDRVHIAERHAGLLSDDCKCPGRARSHGVCRPRFNTVDADPGNATETAGSLEGEKTWFILMRSACLWSRIASPRDRLEHFSGRLSDADWLDACVQRGRLMMVCRLLLQV